MHASDKKALQEIIERNGTGSVLHVLEQHAYDARQVDPSKFNVRAHKIVDKAFADFGRLLDASLAKLQSKIGM